VSSTAATSGAPIWTRPSPCSNPPTTGLGERLWISGSCSLQHVPVDLAYEKALDAEIRNWLAFAVQKLDEIATLKRVSCKALTRSRRRWKLRASR